MRNSDSVKELELRILNNFVSKMTKAYSKRTINWCIVRDILMRGTSHMGSSSCIDKCYELGINPYEYNLERI